MGQPLTVLRVEKLKSWGDVGGAGSHNLRHRDTPNADPSRTHLNRHLVGQPTDQLAEVVREKIGDQTIRKNAVLAFEVVMSASPEYFRPDAPGAGGTWNEQRLARWETASMDWLRKQYGDRVVSAVLHLDEQTPHIQAVVVPLDEKGKLNCRAMLGGSRQTLRDLQTSYAKGVEHLGISRGIEGSKAKHKTVREYYREAESAFEPLPEVKTRNPGQAPAEPEKLGFFAGPEKKGQWERDRAEWERQQAAWEAQRKQHMAEVNAQRDAAVETARRHQAQAAKAAALAKEVQTLKTENSRLLAERQTLKAEADRLRGTDLCDVLTKVYGAQEAADSRPSYRTRKFELGEHGNIAVTGELWTDNATGKGGKGAINLVMHLEGWEQGRYKDAVRVLAEHFSPESVAADMGRKTALEGATAVSKLKQEPLPMPEPVLSNWPRARRYLEDVRKIPGKLIDWASKRGLIYADERANLVFVRDGGGCFKRGSYDPKDRPAFKQTLGRDAGPMVLPGTDGRVFVTEGPIDALALKAINPASTVLATGGNCPIGRLKPYLDRYATERVFLAHDSDPAGNDQAQRLKDAYKPLEGAEVVRWGTNMVDSRKKDWSAVLMARPSLSAFELDQRGEIATPERPRPGRSSPGMSLG
ncbi:MobV family relaxase [Salmonella enterica]|uniref:MobV family relaxase n=1 Tax=Salmonella enterica TaxID=28901 RepID=UPI00249BFDF0|nr:MobV family relaxase [Salmonella enterica]MDI2609049.1 MobV family relaxase [Salmonella enterica]